MQHPDPARAPRSSTQHYAAAPPIRSSRRGRPELSGPRKFAVAVALVVLHVAFTAWAMALLP